MVRTIDVTAGYEVGGGVVEFYQGSKAFSMNVSGEASDDDVREAASARAKQEVARSGCWSPSLVRITDIAIEG